MPHRAPSDECRQRDAERTKRRLLDAAFEEFAAHGFAGARVQDIATRAGVNKQLIADYFGGKCGLYAELQAQWLRREETIAPPELPLAELVGRYLEAGAEDPRGVRLLLWRGLADDVPEGFDVEPRSEADLADTRRRQENGEIAADLDPAAFQFALMAMVIAPIAMPHRVWAVFGLDPRSSEFTDFYREQLRRILGHLAGPNPEKDHT